MHLSQIQTSVIGKILVHNNSANLYQLTEPLPSDLEINHLLEAGLLRRRISSNVKCPVCSGEMEARLDIALVCTICGNQIDLDETNMNHYSSFSVMESKLIEFLLSLLEAMGFQLLRFQDSQIPSMDSLGILVDESGDNIEFHLLTKSLDIATMYAILGHSISSKHYLTVFYPGISDSFAAQDAETIALPRIKLIPISDIGSQYLQNDINRFCSFVNFISSTVESVNRLLGEEQVVALNSDELDFLQSAKTLSKKGREQFEPVVMRLLGTLGITARIRMKGYCPDGALYLPNGFYIVDAKSTASYFKFKVDERDKMLRYIETLEKHQNWFGTYSFFGEIVVTPSLPDPVSSVLEKVENHFQRKGIKGHLVIISSDGLLKLYRNVYANTEYFSRLDLREHPMKLFSESHKYGECDINYDKVVYLSERTLEAFYERVMNSPISVLDGRTVSNLTDLIVRSYTS